jgi:hypothetical protein
MAGKARHGAVGLGQDRFGWRGGAMHGIAWRGKAGVVL